MKPWVTVALAILGVIALYNVLSNGTASDNLVKDTLSGLNAGAKTLEGR